MYKQLQEVGIMLCLLVTSGLSAQEGLTLESLLNNNTQKQKITNLSFGACVPLDDLESTSFNLNFSTFINRKNSQTEINFNSNVNGIIKEITS